MSLRVSSVGRSGSGCRLRVHRRIRVIPWREARGVEGSRMAILVASGSVTGMTGSKYWLGMSRTTGDPGADGLLMPSTTLETSFIECALIDGVSG